MSITPYVKIDNREFCFHYSKMVKNVIYKIVIEKKSIGIMKNSEGDIHVTGWIE